MRSESFYGSAMKMVVSLLVAMLIANPANGYTLFAGVTHSEVVPPKNRRYPLSPETPQKGIVPNLTAPVAQQPKVIWYRIPKWMAGKWTKQGDLTISYTDLRSGVTTPSNRWTDDEMTVTWGNQIDRAGDYWNAYILPSERDSESYGRSLRFVIVDLKHEPSSPEQAVSRVHSLVTESIGNQVVEAFQQESLNDYCLLPSGQLENHSSNRDFTDEGQPFRQGMLVSRFTKVGPFEVVATLKGIDLLKSLNDYLKSHNLSHLVRQEP